MKYFFDTEFIEDGKTIDLISIGIVCEDGRELQLTSKEADLSRANDWVRTHVLPHLPRDDSPEWVSRHDMAQIIKDFVRPLPKPELWAYYADYDWVALCQLFGTMMGLPKHFPMFCMDLKQLSVMKGSPKHPEQDAADEHWALGDARWNLQLYRFLEAIK